MSLLSESSKVFYSLEEVTQEAVNCFGMPITRRKAGFQKMKAFFQKKGLKLKRSQGIFELIGKQED